MTADETDAPTLFGKAETEEQPLAVKQTSQEVAVQPDRAPPTIIEAIMTMAKNPEVRMDVLAFLFDKQAEAERSQRERAYNAAMNKAQSECKSVVRDLANKQTNSMYASEEAVDDAIRPIYTKYGFSVQFNQAAPEAPGNIRIAGECTHSVDGDNSTGFTKTYWREAPPDVMGPQGKANKTFLHGAQSTETYLKRAIMRGIFHVVLRGKDDDGNKGGAGTVLEEQADDLMAAMLAAGITDHEKIAAFLKTHTNSQPETAQEVLAADWPRLMNLLTMMAKRKGKPE